MPLEYLDPEFWRGMDLLGERRFSEALRVLSTLEFG